MSLPQMLYSDGIRKAQTVTFGGYDHTAGAQDGAIYDMENMSGELYPVLSPRRPRWNVRDIPSPNGICAHDGLFWVSGTGFYAGGVLKGTVTDGEKRFASLGAYIAILPDKKYYNRLTDEFGALEASWSGPAKMQDGSYAGEKAGANTIYAAGADFSGTFKKGDAVTISGCTVHPENNRSLIIREIDGGYLRFYENSFTIAEGGDEETLTVKREVPDMDFICENENRLWGCRGDEIYASKLGDIFNWNVFDGVSTDSYAVSVGSSGDFTGACSYLGYPCFFKEEHIYKVYGDRPSNFQVMGSASLGVMKGSSGSLAIAGETLFYLSRIGIVGYAGGIPQTISLNFGTQRFRNGVAGSDGRRYYVSMRDGDGKWSLFVYDTQLKLWHREDATQAAGFCYESGLYCLTKPGKLWLAGGANDVPPEAVMEESVSGMAEFADFVESDPNRKGTSKLQVRLELGEGAWVRIEMMFDSDGVWREVRTLETARKRSFYLPIIPRRSDHFRIRFTGRGEWRLHSLVRESYSGSEM